MSKTVTIDYDEYQKLLKKVEAKEKQIKLEYEKKFETSIKLYKEFAEENIKRKKQSLLLSIQINQNQCSLYQNFFGNIKAKTVKKWLDEIEERVSEM